MDTTTHPCFNDKVRNIFARVHLPVAPRCNMQCNYCYRDFDCVNESRPGVTSCVLTPEQAILYLDNIIKKIPNIKVVGIAGPGEPFANPEETLITLKLVSEKYPNLLLCVATNGLNVIPYISNLKKINITHVTITINAIKPETAMKIYSWYRIDKRVVNSKDGATLLLNRQFKAISLLKSEGIIVKVNSVIIPNINDDEIITIAQKVGELGADIMNCIPLYKTKGSKFESIEPPTSQKIDEIRKSASLFIPQMHNCGRCRADAVGIIGEDNNRIKFNAISITLNKEKEKMIKKDKPYVAVASREGVFINLHLGEAREFMIFGKDNYGGIKLIEKREISQVANVTDRWEKLAKILYDVSVVLVSSAGEKPIESLRKNNIDVYIVEGIISEVVEAVFNNNISKYQKIDHRYSLKCNNNSQCCGKK
ncbi:MAG: radical SAM protein [Chitinispirillaceae bacterium]|nr:radical SAM protein [Chitinispirillaceae bacterium]